MGLVMRVLRLLVRLLKVTLATCLFAAEAFVWLIAGVRAALSMFLQSAGIVLRLRGRVLRCPRGHVIPIHSENYDIECACGFVYRGSLLRCPNPECPAPTTPYVDCECGLSVPNPLRLRIP